jgi:hypothetical protein
LKNLRRGRTAGILFPALRQCVTVGGNAMTTLRSIIPVILFSVSLAGCGQTNDKKSSQRMTQKNYFDSSEHVFIKLYKRQDSTFLYWETWNVDDKNATAHWGQLGSLGEQEKIGAASHSDFKHKVNSLITDKISEGYDEIPFEEQFTVAVTFKLKTWGTPKDLDRREEIRNILTEHLGWTGNGRCDDGDIGSGEMTLFADVIDPFLAVKTIPKEFKVKNVNDEYYFTITQGDKTIAEKIIPNKE